ncbi:hypothetical protein I6H48_06340 [Corynebacterium amycolatum]|uniref:Phage tail protein n=1 Tax=Corynebacterium amycolatum TaxID=43765 RepID=A0A7T4G3N7_CORAY|nr:hypothetical protein [Corynebacterium amycolatum]QQB81631.1 hypothetical protein I6H48_06340 [Corynebacterium amycolatum]
MTTVFVDLVNLDGSRPEGTLRFSLERLVLGDPDIVPSAVEVKIRDGKARVEGLLPGAMRVRVNAGCWSKDWQIAVPAEGEHDLFALLGEQAKEFEHALWATLLGRVEALENTPPVDLAPVEKRLDALEGAPVVDLAPLEDATRQLDNRVTVLESKPDPQPFDPAELTQQLAAMQAELAEVRNAPAKLPDLKPVLISDSEEFWEDEWVNQIYGEGMVLGGTKQGNHIEITLSGVTDNLSEYFFRNKVAFKCFPKPNGEVKHELWFYGKGITYREFNYFGVYANPNGSLSLRDNMKNVEMTETAEGAFFNANTKHGATDFELKISYYTET